MRHVRMLGLCLVAIFAVVAMLTSSALASGKPEIGKCIEKAGGKYSESACLTKAKKGAGTHEWQKESQSSPSERGFRTEGGVGVLATNLEICRNGENEKTCNESEELDVYVECTSEYGSGEATSGTAFSKVVVVFNGCKLEGSAPCTNTTNPEEIDVNTLKGTIGWINKGKTEVGVDLNPAKKLARSRSSTVRASSRRWSVRPAKGNSRTTRARAVATGSSRPSLPSTR